VAAERQGGEAQRDVVAITECDNQGRRQLVSVGEFLDASSWRRGPWAGHCPATACQRRSPPPVLLYLCAVQCPGLVVMRHCSDPRWPALQLAS
jgi:hypothetical protein